MSGFCKTENQPYDEVVKAILMLLLLCRRSALLPALSKAMAAGITGPLASCSHVWLRVSDSPAEDELNVDVSERVHVRSEAASEDSQSLDKQGSPPSAFIHEHA